VKFLNPAGLWLLLGVPLLILIYIIKSRHEDRAVSSTFIWKLSDRFMKKRLPLQKLRKGLLFLLQLLMIIIVAFLVARPALVTDDGGKEYIVILDASGSMLTENDAGKSRFDRAVALIEEMVNDISTGSQISIILASDDASYLTQRSEVATELRLVLQNAECTYSGSDIDGALELAQLICDKNSSSDVVVFTDHDFENTENVRVVNVSENEWNMSVTGLTYTKHSGYYTFVGTVVSYEKDASVTVALAVDGKIIDAQLVDCTDGKEATVLFTVEDLTDFEVAKLYTEADDGLEADNAYNACKKVVQENKVLIVSASPLYIESVFSVMSDCTVTVASSLEEAVLSDYNLYIFDGCVPDTLPQDGAVWLIDPNAAVDGLAVSDKVEEDSYLSLAEDSGSDVYSMLTAQLNVQNISISSYTQSAADSTWETILVCDTAPILFTRKEDTGFRTVVLAFDLHDSNLPLLSDFVILVRNLLNCSVPEMLTDTDYSVGEMVSVTVLPQSQQLNIEYPSGTVLGLSVKASYAKFSPEALGIYMAVQTLTSGSSQYVDFFVHLSAEESHATVEESVSVVLAVTDAETADAGTEKGFSEIWFWFVVALLIFILAEWRMYYYEQF